MNYADGRVFICMFLLVVLGLLLALLASIPDHFFLKGGILKHQVEFQEVLDQSNLL